MRCPDIGKGTYYSQEHATTHIVTLVEGSSRFVMLVSVRGKDTESEVGALSQQIQRLPEAMMDTLTWDKGERR